MDSYLINGIEVLEIRIEDGQNGPESVCRCPSCNKLKLYVNKDTLAFHCWVCGNDVMSGKAKRSNGQDYTEPTRTKEKIKPFLSTEMVDQYIRIFLDSTRITPEVKAYFLGHKIPIDLAEKYKIGYSEKTPDYPDQNVAKILGLLNKKGNNRHWKRIIFPVMHQGSYVYFTSRASNDKQEAKWMDSTIRRDYYVEKPDFYGKKFMFNQDNIDNYDSIYILEGIPDFLSMEANGYPNCVSMLGASMFQDIHANLLKHKKTIVVAYDNDKGGNTNAASIYTMMTRRGVDTRRLLLPEGFDVSDFFSLGGDRKFEIVEFHDITSVLEFKRSGEGKLIFGYKDLEIVVDDITSKKASIKCVCSVYRNDGILATNSMDLRSQRSRGMFAKELAQHVNDISTNEFKNALRSLVEAVAEKIKLEKESKEETPKIVVSEKERLAAIKFLSSDRLLYKIKRALERQGIIGEDKNKLLLYLIYTSRLMKKPISCVIKGLSSSGKSYLMIGTLSLIPEEDKKILQQATARAFYYMGEDSMSHKVVAIGEIHGADESQYSIREAQDGSNDGDLIIYTVEKDPETNTMITQEKRVRGPVSFVTTTTDVEINPENETRNFSLYVGIDENKIKQTQKVLEDRYTFQENPLSPDESALLHNAQRCLEANVKVKIPYVKFVLDSFPTNKVRIMRDRARFLVLIETIAVLHQFNRNTYKDEDGNKCIDATIEDYSIAAELLDEILLDTVEEFPPKAKEIYEEVCRMKKEFVEKAFEESDHELAETEIEIAHRFHTTYREISQREAMKLMGREVIRSWSKVLFDRGFFDYADEAGGKGGRGKETKLYPIERDFFETFLPTPEEVAESMGIKSTKVYSAITGDERVVGVEPEIVI